MAGNNLRSTEQTPPLEAKSALYLDNISTTPIHPEVQAAMLPFLSSQFANASSIHKPGRLVNKALQETRCLVAAMLHAQAEEIYLTPSGTHSNNTVLLGRARYCEAQGLARHIVTSTIEHESVSEPVRYLEQRRGWKVTRLAPDEQTGYISASALEAALCCQTSIISISAVDACTGVLQPIAALSALTDERKIFFHTDAALLPARSSLAVLMAVDAISLSGHKFQAPEGIGVLRLRKGASVMPIVFGGGQEKGLLPGTEGMPQVAGLGAAAALVSSQLGTAETRAHLQALQQEFSAVLATSDCNLPIAGSLAHRLPGYISIRFNKEQETRLLAVKLADNDIICGTIARSLIFQFLPEHTLADSRHAAQTLISCCVIN